jgi:uncharacterized membrane protein YgcG
MKKLSIIILPVILVAALFSLNVSASSDYAEPGGVYIEDRADLLTPEEEAELLDFMSDRATETGWNIVIATSVGYYTHTEAEYEIEDIYYEQFGTEDGAGYIMTTEVDNPPGENDYMLAITTGGNARMQKTDTQILDDVEGPFLDYNEYGSALNFVADCTPYQSSIQRFRLNTFRLIFPGLFFAAIPAAICVGVVMARYRAHPKVSAARYLNMNETRFWRREDTFVREFTTRTPISSSSGGGGGGGGGFSGSSSRGGRR